MSAIPGFKAESLEIQRLQILQAIGKIQGGGYGKCLKN
jgi:hypothetical protein